MQNLTPQRGGFTHVAVVHGGASRAVRRNLARRAALYLDTQAVPAQLGLQMVVQPEALGPSSFGVSTAAHTGRMTKPDAISIAQIINASNGEVQ